MYVCVYPQEVPNNQKIAEIASEAILTNTQERTFAAHPTTFFNLLIHILQTSLLRYL